MHMYVTSVLQKTDMKAVALQMALDLLHEKENRDLITGLKSRMNAGIVQSGFLHVTLSHDCIDQSQRRQTKLEQGFHQVERGKEGEDHSLLLWKPFASQNFEEEMSGIWV